MSTKPGSSSLSGTLSSLLRAQHGTALDDVEDSDLDKRIAEIMVQDAKERQKQWGTMGFSAYLDELDDSDAPTKKTNKRFLASMIRNVDQHNQALIQQELDNAHQAQKERRKADGDRNRRLFGSAMHSAAHARSDKGKDRARDDFVARDSRDRSTKDRDSRGRDDRDRKEHAETSHSRRRRREEHSDDSDYEYEREERRRRRREEDDDDDNDRTRRRERHHDHERDDKRSSRRSREHIRERSPRRHRSSRSSQQAHRSRSGRHDRSTDDRIDKDRQTTNESIEEVSTEHLSSRQRSKSTSNEIANDTTTTASEAKKPSRADLESLHPTEVFMLTGGTSIELSPSPEPVPQSLRRRKARTPPPVARVRAPSDHEDDQGPGILPPPNVVPGASKMDKYFEKHYDPRFDVTLEDLTDPHTGFIKEGAFDDWSTMMEVMKAQREYKKEKGMREAEERFQALERDAAKRKAKQRAADEEKDRQRRRKLGVNSDEDDYGPQPAARTVQAGFTAAAGNGIFGYRYVKKGGTREWDLGKETPT